MFGKLTEKIARAAGEQMDFGISTNQSEILAASESFLKYHSLSELFPYEGYDEEHQVYINKNSKGFIFEIGTFTGTNINVERELASLFKTVLPVGYNIQILCIASPKISYYIDNWQAYRIGASEELKEVSKKRAQYFKKKALANDDKVKVRDYRILVSCSVTNKTRNADILDVKATKKAVRGVLKGAGTGIGEIRPKELIQILDEIFNYDGSCNESDKSWNKYQDISSQIIDHCNQFKIGEDNITLDGKWEYRTYGVRKYPDKWSLSQMDKLIGDNLRDESNIPCPFIVSYGVHIVDSKLAKDGILFKANKLEAQASSVLGRWIPSLIREAQELGYARKKIESGEDRLVKTHYQVMLIDKPTRIQESEQVLYNLYNANAWGLKADQYICITNLLSFLPMSWGDGIQEDLSFFKKARTTISEEPIAMLPIRGEFKGTKTPGMLLAGRRGQVIWWWPFDTKGNYNICVIGEPGSGKSFFMQEFCSQLASLSGYVYVLDKGRSFEQFTLRNNGQFLDFNRKANLCVNPFSSIDKANPEAVEDSLAILAPIISQMAGLKQDTTDAEDNLIEEGLIEIWQDKQNDASIDDLIRWLISQRDNVTAEELAKKLFRYSEKGLYGKYFNGKANISFTEKIVVTELGDLAYKESLLLVVVKMMLLFISNQIILQGDRKTPKAVVFDEAWTLLKGKSGAKFIDELVRTIRKHGGSVVCGTQRVKDFFKNDASEAAYRFADYKVLFNQKADELQKLEQNGQISLSEEEKYVLTTLKTEPGQYAEMMIKGPRYSFPARLMVDNFSKVLYSTEPSEFDAVKELLDQGVNIKDAVTKVAERIYGEV